MKPKRSSFDPNKLVLLKQIGKGLLVMILLGVLITAVWYGSRLPSLTIDTVEVSGGETIDHEIVRTRVEQGLEGGYLNLIPKRFTGFYPRADILAELEKIERIHNINIVRNGGTELQVTFSEYTPHALWCDSVEQADCLFLDKTGYAFGQAPQLTGGSFLRFIKTAEEPGLNVSVTNEETIVNLVILVNLLAEQNWFVSHVEIDQVEDVFLRLVGGGELKVLATDEPAMVVDNLLVILNSEEFNHLQPGNFQYIDLRFGNKVYVNEEESVMSQKNVTDVISSTTVE